MDQPDTRRTYAVEFETVAGEGVHVIVPALPDLISEWPTEEEARANIVEGIQTALKACQIAEDAIPDSDAEPGSPNSVTVQVPELAV